MTPVFFVLAAFACFKSVEPSAAGLLTSFPLKDDGDFHLLKDDYVSSQKSSFRRLGEKALTAEQKAKKEKKEKEKKEKAKKEKKEKEKKEKAKKEKAKKEKEKKEKEKKEKAKKEKARKEKKEKEEQLVQVEKEIDEVNKEIDAVRRDLSSKNDDAWYHISTTILTFLGAILGALGGLKDAGVVAEYAGDGIKQCMANGCSVRELKKVLAELQEKLDKKEAEKKLLAKHS